MSVYRWLWPLLLLTLSACSDSSESELRNWMQQQQSQTAPRVEPLASPKQFKAESYVETTDIDPFNLKRLTLALSKEDKQDASSAALLESELKRRKEPLEEFPLDTMTLVGNMVKDGTPVALVVANKLLYQIGIGGHLGQNYGLVTKITETELYLREIVQNAEGKWVERAASLQLQEKSK